MATKDEGMSTDAQENRKEASEGSGRRREEQDLRKNLSTDMKRVVTKANGGMIGLFQRAASQ